MLKIGIKIILINLLFIPIIWGQSRVAPGVAPSRYQQERPQVKNNYEQPPPNYQQQVNSGHKPHVPSQGQVPTINPHVTQQPPMHHQPHGSHPPQPPSRGPHQGVLNSDSINREKDHIAEHMEINADTSKMTEEELMFHYFKIHDKDNNNMLDGIELIKAMVHWHEDFEADAANPPHIYSDEDIATSIDDVLKLMDKNNDGYISWGEYKMTTEGELNSSGKGTSH